MTLRDLLVGAELSQPIGIADVEITALACDSRRVQPGSLFFALRGEKADGNRFVADAVRRGARAVVSELPRPVSPRLGVLYARNSSEFVPPVDIPESVGWAQVTDARKALAIASANFYGRPAESLKLVGITGTNGKTTIAYLMDSILRAAGHCSGLFGTVRYRTPFADRPATTTTPESLDLQGFLAEVRRAGGTHAVMEVSSHSLVMHRVWGCHFAAAVFTNLTREHLDFHKTFEDYFAAKQRLFTGTGAGVPAVGIMNTDDPYGRQLAGLAARTLSYGLESAADITARKFELSFSGLEFTAKAPAGDFRVRSKLVGRINVYNILAAIGAGIALDIPRDSIEAGIARLESVPGRFERIAMGQPFGVVVDYAHTDDALRNLLTTARELNPDGRILVLFGCGGERDRSKRPLMGEAAGRMADLVILTSDNPRSENPRRIINDVVVGLQKAEAKYVIELDRERAIELAMDEARQGDLLLLAGKGHEGYQILGDVRLDFDDREMVRRALRSRGFRG